MGFRDLLAFLTALPLGGGSLEGAARWYPAVPLAGLLVGALCGAAAAAALALTGDPLLAGAVYTLAHVLATGALHLDGFADFSDVLASGARGGEALRVLKDPHRGSGAIAYTTALLLASTAAASTLAGGGGGPVGYAASLAAGHVLAYESLYIASWRLPTTPYRGLARVFHDLGVNPRGRLANLAALAAALAPLAPAACPAGLAAGAAGWLAGLAVSLKLAAGRLGYANGDVLGFTLEASRASALLAGALAVGAC